MSKPSDLKWFAVYLLIGILLQFYFIQPGDTWWDILFLGSITGVVTFAIMKLLEWWTHKPL